MWVCESLMVNEEKGWEKAKDKKNAGLLNPGDSKDFLAHVQAQPYF